MRAEFISIGTELLLGETVDTNARQVARRLMHVGIDLFHESTVGDNRGRIRQQIEHAFERSQVVITSGGLGPTVDDVTREAVADWLGGVPLIIDSNGWQTIAERYRLQGRTPSDNAIRQAMLPQGCQPIPNTAGLAIGLFWSDGQRTLFCLPGVPYEFTAMLDESVLPYIREQHPALPLYSRTFRICGIPEGEVDRLLSDLFRRETEPTVAPYSKPGEVRVRVAAHAKTEEHFRKRIEPIESVIHDRLGKAIYGYDGDRLEQVVIRILQQRGWTLATAESCTGGLVAGRLTDVPGVSAVFRGGLVTYDNAMKEQLLRVERKTLERFGAVSAETAEAMRTGLAHLIQADVTLSVTGIAGPGGGSKDKPVGTVWFSVATPHTERTVHRLFRGDRVIVRERAVQEALTLIYQELVRSEERVVSSQHPPSN